MINERTPSGWYAEHLMESIRSKNKSDLRINMYKETFLFKLRKHFTRRELHKCLYTG